MKVYSCLNCDSNKIIKFVRKTEIFLQDNKGIFIKDEKNELNECSEDLLCFECLCENIRSFEVD